MSEEMSKAIDADGAPAKAGPYSHAVAAGGLMFLSGQGPFEPGTGAVPELFDHQVRQTLRNLATVADAAGGSLAQAVRVGVHLREMALDAVLQLDA